MTYLEKVVLIVIVIFSFSVELSNYLIERKIRKFNKKLTDFEGLFYNATGIEIKNTIDFNEYYQLETMPKRLKQIEFCYQCQLYQSKVQVDKQQKFQKKGEVIF